MTSAGAGLLRATFVDEAVAATAELLIDAAPRTVAGVLSALPIEGDALHGIYSGSEAFTLLAPDLWLPAENATDDVSPGDVAYGRVRGGEHYGFPNLSINPVPNQDMPILIGGTAEAVLKRAARIADGFVSPNTTADNIAEMVKKIHGYRKDYGTDDKPFQMVSVAIDAFDLDGHRKLEGMGIDECCDMPWLYYGGKFKSPIEEKIEHMKRFTDEVIAQFK